MNIHMLGLGETFSWESLFRAVGSDGDDACLPRVCVVCMRVKGVSVKDCQCVEMGEVVPNESPRSEGLSSMAANFT